MAKSARKASPSIIVNRTVPRRLPNSELRPREYLTEKEIDRLQDAARKRSRHGHRDATMILVTYRHGLRASEVCGLRWDQIELDGGRLHVRRAKGGIDNVHPLSAGKSERCVSYVGITRNLDTFLLPSAAVPPRPRDSLKWSPGLERPPSYHSRFTRTCFGTPPAISLPMMVTIPEPSNITWATRISCTRCDTPKWHLIGLRIFGGTKTSRACGHERKGGLASDPIVERW